MKHILLRHRDSYYEYEGANVGGDDPGLCIGTYEAAWLSDCVMAFLFEKMSLIFRKRLIFSKYYRDDCFFIFDEVLSDIELDSWHQEVSDEVENIAWNKI